MKKQLFLYGFIVILTVFLYSCENLINDNLTIKIDKKTFEIERNNWNNQNLKNYQFTHEYFSDAGPLGPVKITVKENEEPIIENENQYNEYIAENIPGIYDFINETFNFIETVKNGTYNGYKIRSITLTITYNTQYHYPTSVDLSTGYVESIDGGAYYTLKVTEFTPLN